MLHESGLATSAYQMISTNPLGIYADLQTEADAVEVALHWVNSMTNTNVVAFVGNVPDIKVRLELRENET